MYDDLRTYRGGFLLEHGIEVPGHWSVPVVVGAESYGRVPSPTLEGKLLAEGKEAIERTYRKRRWTEGCA